MLTNNKNLNSDTIAAISTPKGSGGVSIIKISGSDAMVIITNLLKIKKTLLKDKKILVKNFLDLSKAVILFFKAPNSYTGEDVVEIQVVGGVFLTEQVLREVVLAGARLAKEGEFTKRALLNGKMTLVDAENIFSQLAAETKKELELISSLENKKTTKLLRGIYSSLLNLSLSLNVFFDYPEENEVSFSDIKKAVVSLDKRIATVKQLLFSVKKSREGVKISIVGKPNAGKSSIFNLLLDESRSIVTSIKGTTRDVVSETIILDNIKCILSDTAGIRKNGNIVENLGIKKTKELIKSSDIVIYVVDSSKKTDINNISSLPFVNLLKNKEVLFVYNKKDLVKNMVVSRETMDKKAVFISSKNKKDRGLLLKDLKEIVATYQKNAVSSENIASFSLRSELLINNVSGLIGEMLFVIEGGDDILKVQPLLVAAIEDFSEILGKNISSASVDAIFSKFCIGK